MDSEDGLTDVICLHDACREVPFRVRRIYTLRSPEKVNSSFGVTRLVGWNPFVICTARCTNL